MREFDYSELPPSLACNEIMNLLAAVHEYKGKQELFVEARQDILVTLLEIARVQSTGASNRIEGINTSDERLAALVEMKAEPRNRSEEEIAGYREVLSLIHESYDHIALRPNIILQLHRDLYQFNPTTPGGKFKAADNIIAETTADGRERVRFKPLPAFETPAAMDGLCAAFNAAIDTGKYDPLLLIPRFILDFLCIHPFADGNGRMSRLLSLLLLYRSGYLVGKYISLELIIEQTKETYYEALETGSAGWHEGANDCLPFARHFLEVLLKAYREFSYRVDMTFAHSLSKPERIRSLFDNTLGQLSKKDILNRFPDISASTVEASLSILLKEGFIAKLGAGKKTRYIRARD